MIKWFANIALVLLFVPFLLSAKIKKDHFNVITDNLGISLRLKGFLRDTTNSKNKKPERDDKKKVKEVAKAKKQPRPEKLGVVDNTAASKPKQRPKRQRRPEGLERPPEIPRRNGG